MRIHADLYPGGRTKAITMSYDDGRDFDRRLVEIFNRHGIRGTFHLNSGKFGRPGFVTADEIASLYAGHEVSVHTLTHPFLDRIPGEELVYEVMEDRRNLETACGYPVRGMSYPYGNYNDAVIARLRSLGMVYSRTTVNGSLTPPADFMRWNPTCHHRDCMTKLEAFRTSKYSGLLLYVWGHSFEFDREDNWPLIEQFCAEAGGDENVWYATNIELYDYLSAQRALVLSADRSTAYNPSGLSVWVSADGAAVECRSGAVTHF